MHISKITLWNFFCLLLLTTGVIYLLPFTRKISETLPVVKNLRGGYIEETEVTSTIWKRGKYPSTTTIKEKKASSNLTPTPTHAANGWIDITWKKDEKDSGS